MIDTHIHLSNSMFQCEFPYLSVENGEYIIERGTREQLIEKLKSAGIESCIEPAIDIESNFDILTLAEKYPSFLFSAVGVHPTRTFQYKSKDRKGKAVLKRLYWKQKNLLRGYSACEGVVAIGETGLDYHLPRKEQHRFRQMMWFIYQLKLAHKRELPVILHIRQADKDAIRILKIYRHCLHGGVCHCFKGNAETAEAYTNLGLNLGIGGALLTNSKIAVETEQAVIKTPLKYILLETDGPFVKPECPDLTEKQLKKARNTSLILPKVAQRIAELKGITVEEVMRVTSENALNLFGIQ